jgi:D-xylose transport system ATP-binding protein
VKWSGAAIASAIAAPDALLSAAFCSIEAAARGRVPAYLAECAPGAPRVRRTSTIRHERFRKRSTVADAPILALRGINKSFGAVQVLHDVNFHVYPGEVMALVGDNGAGKSTLVKCVAGIHPVDSGEILFDGSVVQIHSPRDAASHGIEIVYQDLALCDNLDIVENMFLGRELYRPITRKLDEATMERRARETLRSLSVRTVTSVRQVVSSLSGGQRQTVAIAKAVLWQNRVVLLDEPTAALGVAQTRQVLDLVRRLADSGIGVVLISHNMNDVMEVADRVTALYLGRVAAEVKTADMTYSQIVELITAGRTGNIGLQPATAAESA